MLSRAYWMFGMLLLVGCASETYRHGFIEVDKKSLLEAHTKEEIRTLLGTPTAISPFLPETWTYIGMYEERKMLGRIVPKAHQVLLVRFDESGRLSSTEERLIEGNFSFPFVREKDPSITSISHWYKIRRTLMRFDPAQLMKNN